MYIDVILKKKYNHAFECHKYMGYPIVCCLYMPLARSRKGGGGSKWQGVIMLIRKQLGTITIY